MSLFAAIESLVQLSLFILLLVLIFAYFTKPSDESFKKFIKLEISKQTQTRLLSALVTKMLNKEIKDYIFFKIAIIHNIYDSRQDEITFLGLFQTWSRI